jgi:hypothetical protein
MLNEAKVNMLNGAEVDILNGVEVKKNIIMQHIETALDNAISKGYYNIEAIIRKTQKEKSKPVREDVD